MYPSGLILIYQKVPTDLVYHSRESSELGITFLIFHIIDKMSSKLLYVTNSPHCYMADKTSNQYQPVESNVPGDSDLLVKYPLTKERNQYYGTLRWALFVSLLIIFAILRKFSSIPENIILYGSMASFLLLKFISNTKLHGQFLKHNWIDEKELNQLEYISAQLYQGLIPSEPTKDYELGRTLVGTVLITFGYVIIAGSLFINPDYDPFKLIITLVFGYYPLLAGGYVLNTNYNPLILENYMEITEKSLQSHR